VSRFFLGFISASVLWGVGFWIYTSQQQPEPVVTPATEPVTVSPTPPKTRKKRKRGAPRGADESAPSSVHETVSGDDLGKPDSQEVDLNSAGDERRLTQGQIQSTLTRAMPDIRRCVANLPEDVFVSGKLAFGLRVRASGDVARVRLSGLNTVVEGATGECLRGAVKRLQFPTFSGADMFVQYPVYLD